MATIRNGMLWYDQNQTPVSALGGCLLSDHGTYYLFGEYRYTSKTTFAGFSRYTSTDLEHWTNTGLALAPQPDGLLGPGRIGERVKVFYAQATDEAVMLMHTDDQRSFDPVVCFATAAHLADTFQFQGPLLYQGQPIRMWHIGIFTDTDGVNYLLTHEGDIYRLAPDGHSVDAQIASNIAPGTEAPAMFRVRDTYYFIASEKTSWERNDNLYFSAPDLAGPWTNRGTLCPPGTLTYDSQAAFVYMLPIGDQLIPMYLGDRRSIPDQIASTHVWLPIQVDDNHLSIPDYWSTWDPATIKPVALGEMTPIAWQETTANAGITLAFHGSKLTLWGTSGPHNGYAKITLTKPDGTVLHQVLSDFYSQLTTTAPRYQTPQLPVGDYHVSVQVTGKHGNWQDKSRRQYGSDGDAVKVTGYTVTDGTGPATIYYQEVDRPYDLVSLISHSDCQPQAPTTGEPNWLWLQTDIGSGEVKLPQRTITLTSGEGLLITAKTPFSCTTDHPYWYTSCLRFTGKMLPDLTQTLDISTSLYFPVLNSELAAFISKNADLPASQFHQRPGADLVYSFLLTLTKQRPTGSTRMQKLAEAVLTRIQVDFRLPLTNSQLAASTNYSVQYMLQAFTMTYHTTPRRTLAAYRVAHAQHLLWQQPTLPLSQVATACGFSSEAYLIRAFKRHYHLTPGQFRAQRPEFTASK